MKEEASCPLFYLSLSCACLGEWVREKKMLAPPMIIAMIIAMLQVIISKHIKIQDLIMITKFSMHLFKAVIRCSISSSVSSKLLNQTSPISALSNKCVFNYLLRFTSFKLLILFDCRPSGQVRSNLWCNKVPTEARPISIRAKSPTNVFMSTYHSSSSILQSICLSYVRIWKRGRSGNFLRRLRPKHVWRSILGGAT